MASGMLSGCAPVADSLCTLPRPPFTEKDVDVISDPFARWTLQADTLIEGRCPK